jgi:LuxR family maltose regulon positive regulatory protein
MAAPLLTTKLYIPPVRPEIVPRPRLIEHLDAGLERKLTLVSAPAGYGKTTLISAWLHAAGVPFAWLSLDEGDNDPVRFFTYLIAALQDVDAKIGQSVEGWLQAPQAPDLEQLSAALINDIAATPRSFVLVLDDHHVITERGIHESLSLLLERQPPQMHLVIATRHDPPVPLARLRARGELVEVRQSDLCFTTEEATAFLNESLALDLPASEVALLGEHTEGWIAGLQLAGLSMRGRDAESVAHFIRGFSGRHHFILDYLTDEVLKRQPAPVQEFLLRTSILERMCGPLCDLLAGQDDGTDGVEHPSGQAMLEELQGANLFVVPLDDERKWYRYHHLFAQLLRARLDETRPGLAADLHRRAATWHEENGLGFGAVQHALATEDHALAAAVVERTILKLDIWSSTEITTVLGWMKALPDDVVLDRPWLRLFIARTLYVSGQWEQTDQMLQDLEDWLYEHPETPDGQRLLTLVVADRAGYALVHGEVRKGRELVRRMLARASQDEVLLDVRAAAMLGMAHMRCGEAVEAERAFSRAVHAAPVGRMGYAIAPIICNLAEAHYVQGQLRRAWQTCERAIETGTVEGQRHATTGFAGLLQGKILYEWNDLEAAEHCLQEGLDLLRRGGIGSHFGNLYATLAQTKQARGDREGARSTIERAVRTARGANIPRLLIHALAHQARIWLARGELALARRWASDYRQTRATEYIREFEDCTLARVLLAGDQPGEALPLLDDMASRAEEGGRDGALIEILVLRALARAPDDLPHAVDDLARVLDLAEPEGYVRTFVDLGEPMAVLLRQAATRGISPAYASKLLTVFGDEGLKRHATAPARAQPLVEPLSDRELEVLQLLAEGLSNPEIGRRLFISLPTVKSHTRNIYGKLGVHSRKQAVAQARALGVLPSL